MVKFCRKYCTARSGVTMLRSTAPTDFPQSANAQPLKRPIAHRKKDNDMTEVFPDRTAPSQISAS